MNQNRATARCSRFITAIRERTRLETGFSMLEAVVVVGVLLALAVGGFLAYGKITENAKNASVKAAASNVYTAAQAANFDGDASTRMADVLKDYNDSQGAIKVELIGAPPVDGNDFCIEATNLEDTSIKARFGGCDSTGIPVDPGGDDGSGSTFVPLTATNPNNHVISANDLAYMNSFLSTFADPSAVDKLNNDPMSLMQAYWIQNENEPERVSDWENIFANLSSTDPEFADQKAAMDNAKNSMPYPLTEEGRVAIYDTALTVYKKMIASDQKEYRLVASPVSPDSFGDRTWSSNDDYPTFKLALPPGTSVNSGTVMGGMGVYNGKGGTGLIVPEPLTVLTENGQQYVEVTVGGTRMPGQKITLYMSINDDNGNRYYQQAVLNIQ